MNKPSNILDGVLVLEYRSGSKKALDLLVKKYHLKLCRHANYYTKDIELAKDVVQDSWAVILKKLHTLKDPNLFGSWAFRIVTRKALNALQKSKKNRNDARRHEYLSNTIAPNIQNETAYKPLQQAIAELSENQQIVLRLFYTEAYSLYEISTILDVAEGTVKSRLFHAREKLKTKLKSKL